MAEKTENQEDSPFAYIQKPLRRLQMFAWLGIIMCIALFAGSVAVVTYSGVKSMSAFEDLPKFRVNSMVLDYREVVATLDRSMQATQDKLSGPAGQFTLRRARELSDQLIASEQAFDALLAEYAQAMAQAAEQTGGALEWNRHFQSSIDKLRQRSEQRQATLQAFYEEFPRPLGDEDKAAVTEDP